MNFPQCKIIFPENLPEKEILFIGGGKFPGEKYFLQLAENREIFCIDKGIELCHKLNILPKILIGDFDSANKISVDWAKKNKIPIKRHPVEKDFTDTQLAINFAERSEENFSAVMAGVFGGRVDHLFGNIFTCANSTKKFFLADDKEIIFYLNGGELAEIHLKKIPLAVSLLPISKICEGVTTKNLHWELNNAELLQNFPNAVSNRAESSEIKISIERGKLAIYFCFEEKNF